MGNTFWESVNWFHKMNKIHSEVKDKIIYVKTYMVYDSKKYLNSVSFT